MTSDISRGTLLNISVKKEKYGRSLVLSIAFHCAIFLLLIYGGSLLPTTTITLGSGPGGGSGEDISTVGVVDELSGGIGMYKPALVPKPPALIKEPKPETTKAIPLPQSLEPKKIKPAPNAKIKDTQIPPTSNIIPVLPEPGSGGMGGRAGGSGGGAGGGVGIFIGEGTGGFGDSWYAQRVEARISSNWTRPPKGVRVEVTYSFFIAADGTINSIRLEKSSGNPGQDLVAKAAIENSKDLPAPPPEFRGRPIRFVAQFVYPPPNP
jgi:TonB family protein